MDPGADGTFSLAWCAVCRKEVLPYVALDGRGEVYRCLHCATPLEADRRGVTVAELAAAGYAILDERGCGCCGRLAAGGDGREDGPRS